jgi:hypothetical protein
MRMMQRLMLMAALATVLVAPSLWAQTEAYAADDDQWHFAYDKDEGQERKLFQVALKGPTVAVVPGW